VTFRRDDATPAGRALGSTFRATFDPKRWSLVHAQSLFLLAALPLAVTVPIAMVCLVAVGSGLAVLGVGILLLLAAAGLARWFGGQGSVGYLLKDRLVSIDALYDAIRRIIARGTVLDPEVVSALINARQDPLSSLTPREQDVLGNGGGADQPGHCLPVRRWSRHGRKTYLDDFFQARITR
jgi:hypothetical protein